MTADDGGEMIMAHGLSDDSAHRVRLAAFLDRLGAVFPNCLDALFARLVGPHAERCNLERRVSIILIIVIILVIFLRWLEHTQ
jgi:hypothetical protein